MIGGFEYTLGNVGSSGLDIGLLAEYSHDTRPSDFTQPPFSVAIFDNDLFIGSRLALNDVQSTTVLGGAILDVELGTVSWLVEASRRVGETFTADFEIRAAAKVDPEDPLYFFRRSRSSRSSGSFRDSVSPVVNVSVARSNGRGVRWGARIPRSARHHFARAVSGSWGVMARSLKGCASRPGEVRDDLLRMLFVWLFRRMV